LIKSPKGTPISEDSNIPLIKSPKGTPNLLILVCLLVILSMESVKLLIFV
jgi:hypothetical protein